MKKYLLILIMLLLLTGCDAEYTITFDDDMKVHESIKLLEDNEFYEQYYKSTTNDVINFLIEPYKAELNNNGYNKKNIIELDKNGVLIDNEFKEFSEYQDNSKFIKLLTDNIDYNVDDRKVSIKAKIIIDTDLDSQDQESHPVSNLKLNIKVPFKVISSNADKVDSKNSIYTWYIDEDNNEKSIDITFEKPLLAKKYYSYIFLGILLLVLLIVAITIYGKFNNEKTNEI